MITGIKRGFEEGCGISLEQAIRSERYAELVTQEKSLFEKYPESTNEGVALRAGSLRTGVLLNTLPEAEAVNQARLSPFTPHNPDTRALVQYLGECVVLAATACLPEEIINLARQWQEADSEGQIVIAKQVYDLFVGEQQKRPGTEEINWQTAHSRLENMWQNLQWRDHWILPKSYGKWGQGGEPNCQGKNQMLTAFARLAGARVIGVNPLISAGMIKDQWIDEMCRILVHDLESRAIQFVDPSFRESLEAHLYVRSMERMDTENFHVGAALQLKDGRWVLIDPHALDWGVFPPHWHMEQVDYLLHKYGTVLPGISIQSNDPVTVSELHEQKLAQAKAFLERSRELEKQLQTAGHDPMAALRIYVGFGEPNFVAEREGIQEVLEAIGAESLAIMTFLGGDKGIIKGMLDPENYLNKRIDSAITYHHCEVMNSCKDQVTEQGLLIHPVCEFMLPEYHIAISMINSLDHTRTVANRFLMDHSFDQLTFHNALFEALTSYRRPEQGDVGIARAAAQALCALKFMHPACKKKLQQYFQTIKETMK